MEGLPTRAAVQELLRLDERRVVEEVLGHAEECAGAGGGLGDAVGLIQGRRDGLLAGDVLARLEGGYGLLGVQVGRREQLDGVDLGVLEHLLVARVYPGRDTPLGRPALGALAHGVAQGHDVARLVLQVARRVELGYGPAPNDGEADPGLVGMHGNIGGLGWVHRLRGNDDVG